MSSDVAESLKLARTETEVEELGLIIDGNKEII